MAKDYADFSDIAQVNLDPEVQAICDQMAQELTKRLQMLPYWEFALADYFFGGKD